MLKPNCNNIITNVTDCVKFDYGRVSKSGYKTCVTNGLHISSIIKFNEIPDGLGTVDKYYRSYNNNTITEICEGYLLLVHGNTFALNGDSGGLVYYEVENEIVPLGIVIECIVKGILYTVLPIAFIDKAIKDKGIDIKWDI
uniref:Uncharacterized protein n=1 Tax=Chromulina nebulosa TaxID=96789 RepID=A0A6T5WLK7_9STRA